MCEERFDLQDRLCILGEKCSYHIIYCLSMLNSCIISVFDSFPIFFDAFCIFIERSDISLSWDLVVKNDGIDDLVCILLIVDGIDILSIDQVLIFPLYDEFYPTIWSDFYVFFYWEEFVEQHIIGTEPVFMLKAILDLYPCFRECLDVEEWIWRVCSVLLYDVC